LSLFAIACAGTVREDLGMEPLQEMVASLDADRQLQKACPKFKKGDKKGKKCREAAVKKFCKGKKSK